MCFRGAFFWGWIVKKVDICIIPLTIKNYEINRTNPLL
jgi:hypothetical protein